METTNARVTENGDRALVVGFSTLNTMSVIDELSIGTRIAWPLSLPFSSGNTWRHGVVQYTHVDMHELTG